jgi:hypothetical protein
MSSPNNKLRLSCDQKHVSANTAKGKNAHSYMGLRYQNFTHMCYLKNKHNIDDIGNKVYKITIYLGCFKGCVDGH